MRELRFGRYGEDRRIVAARTLSEDRAADRDGGFARRERAGFHQRVRE